MGEDADMHTTEAADGLGTQIAVVHAGKMREVLTIGRVVQMIELLVGGDSQIDNIVVGLAIKPMR